jgi:hypothetical protein
MRYLLHVRGNMIIGSIDYSFKTESEWYCLACKKYVLRDTRLYTGRKTVKSYCEETGRDVLLRRVSVLRRRISL